MHKAAIYIRLSKEDENKQDAESESIVNQKAMLTSYAYEKEWEIYKIYSDEDYSGSDATRPSFNEMLRDAENGEFQIVLCKSLSRFARDVTLVETYINGKFLEWGIRFVSPTDYADTGTKGSRKNIQINSLVNQWYLEDLSENIRSVLKHKKEQGQFLSNLPPYGYRKSPEDKHKLIKDENVANVVETIFRLALSEHTIMSIVKRLNNAGYVNPSTYFVEQGLAKQRKAPHTAWGTSTVKRFLHNRVYCGDLVLNVSGKKTYKSKRATKRPESEWIIHEDTHEGYISRDEFYKIQKMLDSRTNYNTAHTSGTKNHYKGLIFCGECGGNLTLQSTGTTRGDNAFYRCARAERGVSICKGTRISQDWLDKELAKEIRKILTNVFNNGIAFNVKKGIESDTADIESYINKLKSRLDTLGNTLSMSYMDKAEGKISQEEYEIIRNGVTAKIAEVKGELEREKKRVSDFFQNQNETEQLLNSIEQYKDFENVTRELITAFVEKIVVNKRNSSKQFDYNVEIKLKI